MGRPKKTTALATTGPTETLALPAQPPAILGVEVLALETQLNRLAPIDGQPALDRYNQFLVASKTRTKDLEAELKGLTGSLNEALTRIRGWFRPATKAHEEFQTAVKRRIADYMLAQEAIQTKQLVAAKEAFEQGDDQAAEAIVEIIDQRPVLTPGTAAKSVWLHEVTDPAAVPREYCEPDRKALAFAVKSGVRSIPGVRIYEDKQFVVHTAGR